MNKELLKLLYDESTEDEIRAMCREKKAALGFDIEKALFPHHPFEHEPLRQMSLDEAKEKVREWASVRDSVWDSVAYPVRDSVRASVRAYVGASVRDSVGASLWPFLADSVADSAAAYVSSIFPNIEKWKGIDHEKGVNPFQSAIDLWEAGYVASFDGKTWRLHTKDGIVWEGEL